jgi:hypothetical protein
MRVLCVVVPAPALLAAPAGGADVIGQTNSRRSKSPKTGLRRVLQVSLAAMLWLATAPGALATPFTYTFTSGASIVLGGHTEAIAGSFTFDTTTATESAVSVTLSGASPYAGTYTSASTVVPQFAPTITALDSLSDLLELFFADPLQYSPDPLILVFWASFDEARMGRGETGTSPIGAAVSPTAPAPVPEPASLALLATTLGIFVLLRRRGKPA